MNFSSLSFLCGFLPLLLVSYYVCPKTYQKHVSVFGSLLFYAWGEPIYVLGLCFLILCNHVLGKYLCSCTDRKRTSVLLQGISFNLFFLLYFKYYGIILSFLFPTRQLSLPAMPLGISFICFTCLSFLIDLYRKQGRVMSLMDTALYISFFPKLLMGPIEPYHRFQKQIDHVRVSMEGIDQGAKWFVIGLAQKLILANSFQTLHEALQPLPSTFLSSWLDAFAYTFQIYFDFNGYSYMAMGLAAMLGYHLMKNFDAPYQAESIQDFWRRWHRSLSGWFRDYIYIPLGGSRVSKRKHIRNLFIVWGLTGIWHGTSLNFLLWGLYYGCLLVGERYYGESYKKKVPYRFRKAITFLCVVFGWVIFANPDLSQLGNQLGSMLHVNGTAFATSDAYFYLFSYLGSFLLAIACLQPRFLHWLDSFQGTLSTLLYFTLFILSLCFLLSNGFQSFLYVQF